MDINDFNEFYVTLPSNSSRFDTNNTKSNFKTHLIEPLKLKQPYEVALVEIVLPNIEHTIIDLGVITIKNTISNNVISTIINSDLIDNMTLKSAISIINTQNN